MRTLTPRRLAALASLVAATGGLWLLQQTPLALLPPSADATLLGLAAGLGVGAAGWLAADRWRN